MRGKKPYCQRPQALLKSQCSFILEKKSVSLVEWHVPVVSTILKLRFREEKQLIPGIGDHLRDLTMERVFLNYANISPCNDKALAVIS